MTRALLVIAVWISGGVLRAVYEDGPTPEALLVTVFSVVFVACTIGLILWAQGRTSLKDAATIKHLEDSLADRNETIRLSDEACARRSRKRQGEEQ